MAVVVFADFTSQVPKYEVLLVPGQNTVNPVCSDIFTGLKNHSRKNNGDFHFYRILPRPGQCRLMAPISALRIIV